MLCLGGDGDDKGYRPILGELSRDKVYRPPLGLGELGVSRNTTICGNCLAVIFC